MTLDDLKAYEVEEREPVCGPYRAYTVCGMGPPSSGAVAVQQILGILETRDMAALKPGPEAAHWIAEAGRLAFADRALYLADPAFVNVPVRGLIDPGLPQEPRRPGRARTSPWAAPRPASRRSRRPVPLARLGRHRVRHQPHLDRRPRRQRGRR